MPTPAIKGLENESRLEMTVHQRWAIAILRVKDWEVQGERTRVTFHQPESRLEFQHPWPQPVIGGEKGNSSFTLGNAIRLLDRPGSGIRSILPEKSIIGRKKMWIFQRQK